MRPFSASRAAMRSLCMPVPAVHIDTKSRLVLLWHPGAGPRQKDTSAERHVNFEVQYCSKSASVQRKLNNPAPCCTELQSVRARDQQSTLLGSAPAGISGVSIRDQRVHAAPARRPRAGAHPCGFGRLQRTARTQQRWLRSGALVSSPSSAWQASRSCLTSCKPWSEARTVSSAAQHIYPGPKQAIGGPDAAVRAPEQRAQGAFPFQQMADLQCGGDAAAERRPGLHLLHLL